MDKKSIKGTRTEHNLLASFAGESQARSRYTLFAKKAKEEGYMQIAKIFLLIDFHDHCRTGTFTCRDFLQSA